MIKYIESEKTLLIFKVFSIFSQTNVEGCRCVVWSNEYLLFENYAIFRWNILVRVFKRLYLLDLLKVELRSIRNQFKLKLIPLWRSVIRRYTFNYYRVTFAAVWL